jgi:hypothetical protein
MVGSMRSTVCAGLAAALLLSLTPGITGAAAPLPLGRYTGTTSDGHVFQFTVARSAKPTSPRKITHFWVVYDIAGCRSGPIRQPFFASVYYGKTKSRRGTFSRDIPRHGPSAGKTGDVQLSLSGRFTSPSRASGTFRVGVIGRCPLNAGSPALTFHVKRTS